MATIYIVEDDVNIREIERYALKNSGYQVEEFECGADLFKRLESKVPALILLDIMLPNEDGLDILTKIRADKNTAKVPIIMVTAKTSELDKVKGLDLGADDYISKPFGVMELISRVKALLRRTTNAQEESQISYGNILVDNDKHAVYVDGNLCELTYKEFELFKYLVINKGIVLSRDKISRYAHQDAETETWRGGKPYQDSAQCRLHGGVTSVKEQGKGRTDVRR